MKANIGKIDKIIRVALGLCALGGGVAIGSAILGLIGVAFLISAYLAFCPLYKICKISTKKHDDNPSCCGGSSCGCH